MRSDPKETRPAVAFPGLSEKGFANHAKLVSEGNSNPSSPDKATRGVQAEKVGVKFGCRAIA
jgi:hypothetical protein